MPDPEAISFSERIAQLAKARPNDVAVEVVGGQSRDSIRWGALHESTTRLGHYLRGRGAQPGGMLVCVLPNGITHIQAVIAAWKIGTCVLALPTDIGQATLSGTIRTVSEHFQTVLLHADRGDAGALGVEAIAEHELVQAHRCPLTPLMLDQQYASRAHATSGSTGNPKVIVNPNQWRMRPPTSEGWYPRIEMMGFDVNGTQLVPGPLSHSMPAHTCFQGLFAGQRIILMRKFNAAMAVEAIAHWEVTWLYMVPSMMSRILRVPLLHQRDLSTLTAILHGAAPCPVALKEAWIRLLGPERVWELYGAAEGIGSTRIRGDESLLHPGSVGRPHDDVVRIVKADGSEAASGELGEVYFHQASSHVAGVELSYLGGGTVKTWGEYRTVGDAGWLDADGYLYLADRVKDLIQLEDVTIYPSEVERILRMHPAIMDVVVLALRRANGKDEVCAIVQSEEAAERPSPQALYRICADALGDAKTPTLFYFVPAIPRSSMGKVSRHDLRSLVETGRYSFMQDAPRADMVGKRLIPSFE